MKKTLLFSFTSSLLLCVAQGQSIPSTINYQGRVTDSTGTPIGNTTPVNRKIRFRVFDSAAGTNRKWTEEQTVTISLGEFSVLIGDLQGAAVAGEPNPASFANVFTDLTAGNATRFLGVMVDNGNGTWGAEDLEISPRQQVTSTGFAFRAKVAESLATGGVASSAAPLHIVGIGSSGSNAIFQASNATENVSVLLRDNTGAEKSAFALAGAVGNYSTSAAVGDTVMRTGGGNRLILQNGSGAAALTIKGNNVGIGTPDPGFPLVVAGTQGNFSVHPVYASGYGMSLNSVNATGMQFRFSRTGNFMDIGQDGNGSFVVENNDTPVLTVTQAGNFSVPGNVFAGGFLTINSGANISNGLTVASGGASIAGGLTVASGGAGITGNLSVTGGVYQYGTNNQFQLNNNIWGNSTVNLTARPADDIIMNVWRRNGQEAFRMEDWGGAGFALQVMQGTANKPGGGAWGVYSDARLKKNVSNLKGALERLLQLRPVTFEYNEPEKFGVTGISTGFIAQEVEKVFPEWIEEMRAPGKVSSDKKTALAGEKYKTVNVKGFEAMSVQALRELRAEKDTQIKALTDETAVLRDTVKAQEARLAKLEKALSGGEPTAPSTTKKVTARVSSR